MVFMVDRTSGNFEKWSFRPMAVLLVGQKCSHTAGNHEGCPYKVSSLLALGRKSSFFKVPFKEL